MGEPLNIGIIGLGNISGQYLTTFGRLPDIRLVAVADEDRQRVSDVAAQWQGNGPPEPLTVDALLASPEVELVVTLTPPAAHAAVAGRVVAAGKHVYGEKPLAATLAEAEPVLAAAAGAGRRVLCAPDTVLGTGTQTARKAVDDGLIGIPIAATATMVTPGHECWHPNPDSYYQPGGGPLLDMGPYHLSALVQLLGPVTSVTGAASRSRDTRTIGSGLRAGEQVPVTIDTHVTGVLTHASGVLTTLVMSFDAVATSAANIEVHGSEGSLLVPDPNGFDGDVQLARLGGDGFETLPVSAGYRGAGRGAGIADWHRSGRGEGRVSGALALHVLEIMEAVLTAAGSGVATAVHSTVERPETVVLSDL